VVWTREDIWREKDPVSGEPLVVQITSAPVISNNIYHEQPYCTPDGERFAFIRTFYYPHKVINSLWVCDLKTFSIAMIEPEIQLGVVNSKYSGIIYYGIKENDRIKLIKLSLNTLDKEAVFDLEKVQIGSLHSVSPDQRYCLAFNISKNGKYQIIRLDLKKDDWAIIRENIDIANPHLQYEPSKGNDILVQHRYVIDNEGKNYRPLPISGPTTGHSCWVGDTGEVIISMLMSPKEAIRKGNLIMAKPGAKEAKIIAKGYQFNHVSASKNGEYFVADAWNIPGRPIVIGSIKTGRYATFLNPETSGGTPGYTHPHAYMTGDNKWIVYNSNKTGIPQVYVARIPEEFLDSLQ